MKAVGYCATRNLYPRLLPAINSLLINNPHIDKVYCFLEDDNYSLFKDKRIEVIKIDKDHTPFWKEGANFNTYFTYMSLIRLWFARLLPDLDKILYLDVDTIVDTNIEELWEEDLTEIAVMGVEDIISPFNDTYLNAGVMMLNLEVIRKYDLDGECFKLLNTKTRLTYPDQDAMNLAFKGRKKIIGYEYNTFSTKPIEKTPKIVHYAGLREWWDNSVKESQYYQKYKCESV